MSLPPPEIVDDILSTGDHNITQVTARDADFRINKQILRRLRSVSPIIVDPTLTALL